MAPAAAAGAAAERGPSPASSLAPGAATLVHPAAGRAGAPLSAPVGTPPMDVIRPRRTNIIMSSSGSNQPQVLWLPPDLRVCLLGVASGITRGYLLVLGLRIGQGCGSFRFFSGGEGDLVQSVVIPWITVAPWIPLASPSRYRGDYVGLSRVLCSICQIFNRSCCSKCLCTSHMLLCLALAAKISRS